MSGSGIMGPTGAIGISGPTGCAYSHGDNGITSNKKIIKDVSSMIKGDFIELNGAINYLGIGLKQKNRLVVSVDITTDDDDDLRFSCETDNIHGVINNLLRMTNYTDFNRLAKSKCRMIGRQMLGGKRLCAIGKYENKHDNDYDIFWLHDDGTTTTESDATDDKT